MYGLIKKMTFKNYFLLVMFFTAILSACTDSNQKKKPSVEMPDVYVKKVETKSEIIIDNADLDQTDKTVATFGEKHSEKDRVTNDNSQISTMFDGYGNKIETRYFFNHPNISLVKLKTYADGRQEAIVFGQNGERKPLPAEIINRVLTASGEDIARVAGIFKRKDEPQSTVKLENLQNNISRSKEENVQSTTPQNSETQPNNVITQPENVTTANGNSEKKQIRENMNDKIKPNVNLITKSKTNNF